MKKMIRHIYRTIALMLIAGFISATPATAKYEEQKSTYSIARQQKLELKYDVYAGGFKVLNAALEMDLDKRAYDVALTAETEGFIGSLFPWKASYNTSGHAVKGVLIPNVYTERSSWRNNTKTTEMDFSPNGKVLKTTTQEGRKTTTDRDIDGKLADDTLDLLTGTLAMLQSVKNTSKCEGKFPVFDGKRRYNIDMKDDGTDILTPSKYSRFSGEALRCTLTVEPVAGFKKKDEKRGWMAVQKHTEERDKPPTIWLAKMKGTDQVIPVRMEIASAYGTVIAHLSGGTDH